MQVNLTQYGYDTGVLREVMLGLGEATTLIELVPNAENTDADVDVRTSLDGRTLVTIIEVVYEALRDSGFEPFEGDE